MLLTLYLIPSIDSSHTWIELLFFNNELHYVATTAIVLIDNFPYALLTF